MKVGILHAVREKDAATVLLALLPYVAFAVAFLLLLRPITLRGSSDDTAHLVDIQEMGVLQWVCLRAQTWQPRIVSDFAFATLIFNLRVWKVLNAGVMALLLWTITRTAMFGEEIPADQVKTSHKRFATLAVFVVPMLFLIHPNVIASGSIWYAGSFYYLWPLTAMLIGLAPFLLAFYGKQLPWRPALLPVCTVFGLIACFTEQAALVQCGTIALIFAWFFVKRERYPRYLVIPAALVLVTTIVFFYFDFTSVRMSQHPEIQYFPEFASFSFVDKLVLAVNVYTDHLLHVSNIIFSVLAISAGWVVYSLVKPRILGVVAFLPGLWVLVNTVARPFGYGPGGSEWIGRPSAIGIGIADWLTYVDGNTPLTESPNPISVVLAVGGVLCALSLFGLLFHAFTTVRDRYFALALYLAAFLSGLLNGFSPSVWASGNRPYYISDILILLLIAMLMRSRMPGELSASQGFSLRAWPTRIALVILVLFACYMWYMYHTIFATNTYWWY